MNRPVLTIILGSLLFGCGPDKAKEAAKGNEYVLAGESSLTPQQKKKIVAKVGDHLITLEEFERRLNQQSVFARNRHNSPSRKREFLDSMVRFERNDVRDCHSSGAGTGAGGLGVLYLGASSVRNAHTVRGNRGR